MRRPGKTVKRAQPVMRGERPQNFRYQTGYPLAGSAYIYSPEHARWLARNGFKTVISLETLDAGTANALERFGIKQISFPIEEVFNTIEKQALKQIAEQEWRAGRKVLVHCFQGKGRTGEALLTLWEHARKIFPERSREMRASLARTGEKSERGKAKRKKQK